MEKKSKVLLTFRILIVGEVLSYIICAYFGLVGSESLGITNITRETWNIMADAWK